MDYEKAYKEALEKAKKELNTCGSQDCDAARQIFRFFPELAESEDERIKKELIFYLGDMPEDTELRNGVTNRDVLVWLEKQGEQKPIDKIQLGKKYKCIASPRYSTFRRGNIYKPVDNFLCNLMNLCYECFEPIEDSEQKPADKVEPKFKVKYAGREYNVLEIKEIAGVTYYGIEDEPNHIDYILPDNCEIVRVHGYGVKENGSPYPTKSAIFSEQKHTWSEEDENKIDTIISVYHPSHNITSWLKSLKQRIGWKPSDAQMQTLKEACDKHWEPDGLDPLYTLYEQLKKLKGE